MSSVWFWMILLLLTILGVWTARRYGWDRPRTPADRIPWQRWAGIKMIAMGLVWLFVFPGGPATYRGWIPCVFFVAYGAVRIATAGRTPIPVGESRREMTFLLAVVLVIGAASIAYFLLDVPPMPPPPAQTSPNPAAAP